MKARTILIVDDDKDLALITADILLDYGYQVTCVKDSQKAYQEIENHRYDLIILDINLPNTTGFEICKELRKVSNIPVIFASARTSEDDKIIGLDIGGDDYISKPYSLKELLSRVNALIRRTYDNQQINDVYYIGKHKEIEVHMGMRSVTKNGRIINLSLKEFDVLQYLCTHANQVVKKEELLHQVWGIYSEVEIASVAVHIRWLREKIEDDPSHPMYIKTIWGVGYLLSNEQE